MTKITITKTPEAKSIEIDGEQLHIIAKVKTFDKDIQHFEEQAKKIKERMEEIVESKPASAEVARLLGELGAAKDNLRRQLENDRDWVNLTEELAQENLALSDARANMSDFLLAYFAETHEKQIELGPKNVRELMFKGRLGKQKPAMQTNIFSKRPEPS